MSNKKICFCITSQLESFSVMGEFKVHRVRFFDYMPSAVRALAFEPQCKRIAAARADGSVEIFNVTDHFFQEKVCETGRTWCTLGKACLKVLVFWLYQTPMWMCVVCNVMNSVQSHVHR